MRVGSANVAQVISWLEMASIARSFRVRFGAANLHLQTCSVEECAEKSAEHAAAMVAMLHNQKMTSGEKETLIGLVLSSERGWSPPDRRTIVEALEKLARKIGAALRHGVRVY